MESVSKSRQARLSLSLAFFLSLSLSLSLRRWTNMTLELKSICHMGFSNSMKHWKYYGSTMGQTWKKKKIFQLLVVVPLQHQGQRHGWSIAGVWRLMCPCLVQRHLFCQISIDSNLCLVWVRQTRLAILSLCCLSAAEFWGLASCCTWRRFSCCLALVFRVSIQNWPPLLCVFVNPFFLARQIFGSDCFCVMFWWFPASSLPFLEDTSLHRVTLLRFSHSHWPSLGLLLR